VVTSNFAWFVLKVKKYELKDKLIKLFEFNKFTISKIKFYKNMES